MGLTTGSKLTSTANTYMVVKLLGAGGQGEVYQVKDKNNKEYALKWYFPHTATASQKKILNRLVAQDSPDPCFLWPLDFVESGKQFGYIMPLRPGKYVSIIDLMKCRVAPSLKTLCVVGFNLTKGYQKLHAKGYSYRDISFGNLFFDPDNGNVLICDNDNVSANDDAAVYGTPRFMAPEIVRGAAKPSINTDRFSLAVLLFYILFVSHPLEGRLEYNIHCMDVQAQTKLYGTNPVFIFDPQNRSNEPVPGYHDNALIFWKIYPDYMKDLFIRSFTEGLKDPSKRITEPEWMDAFANMYSTYIICPNCRKVELFYNPAAAEQTCWDCRRKYNAPMTLTVKKQICLMQKGQQVVAHQILRNGDIETVVGTVVSHPKDPSQLGLRNDTQDNWTYIRPDGTQTPVPPARSARIARGCSISFGSNIGEFL